MRVVWSSPALRQVWRAYDYLAEFNPHAASKLADALIAEGETLAHVQHRGRLVPGTAIRELTAVHPYVIRYEIVHDEIWLLRVRKLCDGLRSAKAAHNIKRVACGSRDRIVMAVLDTAIHAAPQLQYSKLYETAPRGWPDQVRP